MLYEAKVLQAKEQGESCLYLVHYKGWKSKWDEWVPQDRLKHLNDQNLSLQTMLKSELASSGNNSSTTSLSSIPLSNGNEKKRKKPSPPSPTATSSSSLLQLPEQLKLILNQDHWEITSNKKIIDLPLADTVTSILDKFYAFHQRQCATGQCENASSTSIAQTVEGLKEYFDKALGLMLLYRFERQQYSDMFHSKEKAWKSACQVYGFVHLVRLLCKIPTILPTQYLPQDKLDAIKGDLEEICNWLAENAGSFFSLERDYLVPPASYQALAKQF